VTVAKEIFEAHEFDMKILLRGDFQWSAGAVLIVHFPVVACIAME
jgi:hypothetical protein